MTFASLELPMRPRSKHVSRIAVGIVAEIRDQGIVEGEPANRGSHNLATLGFPGSLGSNGCSIALPIGSDFSAACAQKNASAPGPRRIAAHLLRWAANSKRYVINRRRADER
jgi:hypothetical protein